MKTLSCILGVVVLAALLQVAPAHAQGEERAPGLPQIEADRSAERARIREEEAVITRRLQQAEAACYQRFAVEDCLRAARRDARTQRAALRQRESLLDDAERRERAARREQDVARRQAEHAASEPQMAAPRAPREPDSRGPRLRAGTQGGREAAARAHQERQRQALDQQAARNRQQQREKQQAADERKARVQKQLEEDKARGRQPAAPLP